MATDFRAALGDPSNSMNQYDAAPGIDPLAAFDAATGETHIPAGPYTLAIVSGRLTTTRDGKTCYLITYEVVGGPHHGRRVYRRYMLDSPEAINRAKAFVAKLGLTTSAALQQPFPGPGRVITGRALVTVREWQGEMRNDLERFDVIDDRTAPPNPNAVDLTPYAPVTNTVPATVTPPVPVAPVAEVTIPRMIIAPPPEPLAPAPTADKAETAQTDSAETPEPSPPAAVPARRPGRPRKTEAVETPE